MTTGAFPMGVSPSFSPSIHTSAQGVAFTAIVPFGNSILIDDTLPAATVTVRGAAIAEEGIHDIQLVCTRSDHELIGLAAPKQSAVFVELHGRRPQTL